MMAAVESWSANAAEWIGWAWDGVSNHAGAVLEAGLEVARVVLALLVVIAIAPALAHLAGGVLLLVLGAPLWFVVALCFGR